MKPLKTKVSVTLNSDFIRILKVLAEEDDRSLNQYIDILLREHVKSVQSENIN